MNVLRRPSEDLVAEAIDSVLAEFPHSIVEWTFISDTWTSLKLVGGEAVLAEVAIWNATGNAYRVGPNGAVEEEPFIEVTESPLARDQGTEFWRGYQAALDDAERAVANDRMSREWCEQVRAKFSLPDLVVAADDRLLGLRSEPERNE